MEFSPISLRVNLDMGKTVYSILMMRDRTIPGTVVRTSTIPEELGRVSYLFSDKTGTLTQNVMVFKKLQLEPPLLFETRNLPMIRQHLINSRSGAAPRSRRGHGISVSSDTQDVADSQTRVVDCITSLALCHNVTPVTDEDGSSVYQASSPDEVALVKFTESVGMTLVHRTASEISLKHEDDSIDKYEVLNIFPFTSESKRMGIIVRSHQTNQITFFLKGAESVMGNLVLPSEWLQEECDNLAREGLRTLVFASKKLKNSEYDAFKKQYEAASVDINDRTTNMRRVVTTLECDLRLLGLSGVEDKLQLGVKSSLETLRNAGIKIWMLTGDKAETATCIGRSARLISYGQEVYPILVKTKRDAARKLDLFGSKVDTALVIDGPSLTFCLEHFERQFLELASAAPVVICCRCSPTQKADIVRLIQEHTQKRCCSIGDGGNDVSMIQKADVGIGIVGKEGKQASLAADFSIDQFSFITRLLLWHGRNSYLRSAKLSQFVIHRGLIIAMMQAVFSALFYFAAIPIFDGWLMVGYATFYTMAPVFSLVLDEDVSEQVVVLFPELYKVLQKGRPSSMKFFWLWVFRSVFQAAVIMLLSIQLFKDTFINVVAISFTALILTELVNVSLEITTWHWIMVTAQIVSIIMYFVSMWLLPLYFDMSFVFSWDFWWRLAVITVASTLPVLVIKFFHRKLSPPAHSKIKQDI